MPDDPGDPDEVGDLLDLLLIINDNIRTIRRYVAVAFWLVVGPSLALLVLYVSAQF